MFGKDFMETLNFGSDPALKASLHSRKYDSSGWLESYVIELQALDFLARTQVDNPGFGRPPSDLFEDLALNWRGWEGIKSWVSMEGELELTATCDRIGHVILNVKIPENLIERRWSAQAGVLIEAGQLDRLAIEVKAYFERRCA